MRDARNPLFLAVLCLAFVCVSSTAHADPQIWEAQNIRFFKPNHADWSLAENQDRITDNVWITRKRTEGIFNIAQEAGYNFDQSPADTEWAFLHNNPGIDEDDMRASNYTNLTFNQWREAHGGDPRSTIRESAVLHLITDDIYINIMFTKWVSGSSFGDGNPGGAVRYIRATSAPAPATTVPLLIAALAIRRRRR